MQGRISQFILALLAVASISSLAQAGKIPVPGLYLEIQSAMDVATSGSDTVIVTEESESHDGKYRPFSVEKNVPVINTSDTEIIVDAADTAAYAAQVLWGADARVEGFTLRGGTRAVARVESSGQLVNCVLISPSGGPTAGIIATDVPTIRGCSITMTGGVGILDTCIVATYSDGGVYEDCELSLSDGIGILVYGSSYDDNTITDCDVSMSNGAGILVEDGSVEITGAHILVSGSDDENYGIAILSNGGNQVSGCFASVPNSYEGIGIYAPVSGSIYQCTVDQADYGFWYGGSAENCIATQVNANGFLAAGAADYAEYCITDLDNGDGFYPDAGTGSVVEDPLYCDAASGEFTLRVDSYGNRWNNDSGFGIGAYPVACIYGTLTRTCKYDGQDGIHPGSLSMPEDVVVPAGDTLSLSKAEVLIDAASPTLVFEVRGRLDTRSGAVTFDSAEESPGEGDWNCLYFPSGSIGLLDSVTVRHSTYGVYAVSPDTLELTNGYLRDNEITDITPYGFSGNHYGRIEATEIVVGSGTGILMTSDCSGLTIEGNSIAGGLGSTGGVRGVSATLSMQDNSVSDFSLGYGISIEGGTVALTGNTIGSSMYGVRVTGGTVAIGTSSSDSDNIVAYNYLGARCDGGSPTIWNNQIYSNTIGVDCLNGGYPDLGNQSQDGKNSIYSNSSYCVRNQNQNAVLAYGNWWGSCQAPSCTQGNVITTGWLCSQPAGSDEMISRLETRARGLRVLPAHPNPTSASSSISFELEGGGAAVAVGIYDLAGRLVRYMEPADLSEGPHEVFWDGRDGAGRRVGNGIYFIRVAASHGLQSTGKVLVVR